MAGGAVRVRARATVRPVSLLTGSYTFWTTAGTGGGAAFRTECTFLRGTLAGGTAVPEPAVSASDMSAPAQRLDSTTSDKLQTAAGFPED